MDGSHNFEDVFIDMYYSIALLEPGGMVLFDDSQNQHVKKVLRFVRRNLFHCLKDMDLRPHHPSHCGIKYRVAQSLNRAQLTAFEKINEAEQSYGYALKDFVMRIKF